MGDIRKEKLSKLIAKKQCKPKRPISAFFFFTIENRKKIYAETPDISFKEIARRSASDWSKLTEEQRKPYDAMREADKLRYDKECK